MRHRILVVLFVMGTVGGYASGFASLRHRSQCRAWPEERAASQCAPCPASAPAAVSPPAAASPEAPVPPGAR